MSVCIFCHHDPSYTDPYCATNPGHGCTYGFHHEYENAMVAQKPPQAKPVDRKLCPKCGMHPKNPAYAGNGCDHAGAP